MVVSIDGVHFAKASLDPSSSTEAEAQALYAARRFAAVREGLRVPALRLARKKGCSFFVSDRVPGRPRRSWDHGSIVLLGGALAELHSVSVRSLRALPGGATTASVAREAHVALEALAAEGLLADRASSAARRKLKEARARALEDSETHDSLCHGDVRAPNVFFDGASVGLIDFEHSGRGDPAIDLARAAAYERLTRHELFLLLDAYSEAAGADDVADRAISMAGVVSLQLALSAARWILDVTRGRIQTAQTRLDERTAALESRLGELLEVDVRLDFARSR